MDFTMIVVFLHLIATCMAVGTLVTVDLRLLTRVFDHDLVVAPPHRLEIITIVVALAGLYITGIALVLLGLADRADYLGNGKLQGKLALVLMLTGNALVLHRWVFPILHRAQPIATWTRSDWAMVALATSFSSSAWFFIAFLGIARAWNFVVTPGFVLLQALGVWAGLYVLTHVFLMLASRNLPKPSPNWISAIAAHWNESNKLPRSRVQ